MSFSSTVKEELSRQLTTARHCQIAEMAAILSLCGRVKISASDHFAIAIHTENLAVARKYFTLLKKTFNINTDVLIRQGLLPARSRTYVVAVREHEDALRVLQAAKLLDANGEIAEDLSLVHNVIVQNTCSSGELFLQQVLSVIRRSFITLRSPVRLWGRQSSFRDLWRHLVLMPGSYYASVILWYM